MVASAANIIISTTILLLLLLYLLSFLLLHPQKKQNQKLSNEKLSHSSPNICVTFHRRNRPRRTQPCRLVCDESSTLFCPSPSGLGPLLHSKLYAGKENGRAFSKFAKSIRWEDEDNIRRQKQRCHDASATEEEHELQTIFCACCRGIRETRGNS